MDITNNLKLSTIFFVLLSCTAEKRDCEIKDLKLVKDHYLNYPYPPIDPEIEARKKFPDKAGPTLPQINHYLFNGRQNFTSNFRILIAGGGTGGALMYYGAMLRHISPEIVFLDFTEASLKIAKRRAEIRNLKNIHFIHDSIYNIPNLNLGKFDFIDCIGVLHHLADPDAGLRILRDSLKPGGGMILMLYAPYGRTGIYIMQDLMKLVNKNIVDDVDKEVKNGWEIFNSISPDNWIKFSESKLLFDHKLYGDAGFYDLFLHKQDRSYNVNQLYDFVNLNGLYLVDFTYGHYKHDLEIKPWIDNPKVYDKIIRNMTLRERQAIGEIMNGNIIKHSIYVSNIPNSEATFNHDNVPYFLMRSSLAKLIQGFNEERSKGHKRMIITIVNLMNQSRIYGVPIDSHTLSYLKLMQNEKLTIKELISSIKSKKTFKSLFESFKKTFEPLKDAGLLVMRHKSTIIDPEIFQLAMDKIKQVHFE